MQPASDRWTFPSPLKCCVLWHPSFQPPTSSSLCIRQLGYLVDLDRLIESSSVSHVVRRARPTPECRWPRGTRPHLLLRRFQFPARNLFTPRLPRPPRGRVVPRRAGGPHDLKCEGGVVRDGGGGPGRPGGRGWSHNRHFHCAAENICIPRRRSASPRVREMECLASSRTQKTNLSSLFLRLLL